MTRTEIITNLYTGKNFSDCINKMEPDYLRDDLKQEVISIICELPEEKLQQLHNDKALEFFTVKVILNQIKSNTSPFAKKYRQFKGIYCDNFEAKDNFDESKNGELVIGERMDWFNRQQEVLKQHYDNPADIEERELKELIEDMAISEIEKLHWYNVGLIELYRKHMNYRAIEKETGIPWQSCYKTIVKSFKEIKQKVTA